MKFFYLLLLCAASLLVSATTENGKEVNLIPMERTFLSEELVDSIVQSLLGLPAVG